MQRNIICQCRRRQVVILWSYLLSASLFIRHIRNITLATHPSSRPQLLLPQRKQPLQHHRQPTISLKATGKSQRFGNLGGKFPNQAALCKGWDLAEGRNETVSKIIFDGRGTTDKDGLCTPSRAGNMLIPLFSVLMMVYSHGIGYEFEPHCKMEDGSILAYFPQNVSSTRGRLKEYSIEEMNQNRRDMCTSPGDPLPVQGKEGEEHIDWLHFRNIWAEDIRGALQKWANITGKPGLVGKTASIHIRCGDILTADIKDSFPYGFSALSLYTKHLKDIDAIDILAPSFTCNRHSRAEDCNNGQKCSKIVHSIKDALAQRLFMDPESIQIRDDKSELWTMHHIAFSDIVICSPQSTFCGVISLATKLSVHQLSPWAPEPMFINHQYWDDPMSVIDWSEYLSMGEISAKNMTTDDIIIFLLNN